MLTLALRTSRHAAPGAHNLLQRLHPLHPDMKGRPQDAIDPDCRVSRLTTQQFISLARAFEKWPFRPKHLFVSRLTSCVRLREGKRDTMLTLYCPSDLAIHRKKVAWRMKIDEPCCCPT